MLNSLTSNNKLTLVFDDGGIVLGDAGVGAVVHSLEVGDPQGAGEVDVVDGHPQAGINGLSILLPGDRDGKVTWAHNAGHEDAMADGITWEFERLDEGRHWRQPENIGKYCYTKWTSYSNNIL